MLSEGSNSILWRSTFEKPLYVDASVIFFQSIIDLKSSLMLLTDVLESRLVHMLEIKIARCFLQGDSSGAVSRRCCKGLIVTASSVLFWMFW